MWFLVIERNIDVSQSGYGYIDKRSLGFPFTRHMFSIGYLPYGEFSCHSLEFINTSPAEKEWVENACIHNLSLIYLKHGEMAYCMGGHWGDDEIEGRGGKGSYVCAKHPFPILKLTQTFKCFTYLIL